MLLLKATFDVTLVKFPTKASVASRTDDMFINNYFCKIYYEEEIYPFNELDTRLDFFINDIAVGTQSLTLSTPEGDIALGSTEILSKDKPVVYKVNTPMITSSSSFTVTVMGKNFTGATSVKLDNDTEATTFTVVSDTEITVTFPSGSTGKRRIIITTPAGDNS